MIGLLLNGKEQQEIEYLLKREMDEILFDLEDERIADVVKVAMKEKYEILLSLFKRVVPADEYVHYKLNEKKNKKMKKSH
ncbi:hypothetical protein LCM23_21690 [Cytobacillus kochii]|uniref:hypothetical protein n=1 Tax=Cytobacillus kochii TaxID=859143 RepID=UPI001CD237D9|nr:hypothetical protein [Cytobacillus kochii]MCA1028684.1 hypothetical protein [Cytobacillus kochii]